MLEKACPEAAQKNRYNSQIPQTEFGGSFMNDSVRIPMTGN